MEQALLLVERHGVGVFSDGLTGGWQKVGRLGRLRGSPMEVDDRRVSVERQTLLPNAGDGLAGIGDKRALVVDERAHSSTEHWNRAIRAVYDEEDEENLGTDYIQM
ncbi:hypothetical protein FS837_006426, partial [Tulasnella sp. UAMH 9824]